MVTAEERARYDALFLQTDIDKDGFVSGPEIKDVFLQSGVPQQVLAHIWYMFMLSGDQLKVVREGVRLKLIML